MPNPIITTTMTYEENLALKNILWTLYTNAFDSKIPFTGSFGKEYNFTKLWNLYYKQSKRGRKLDKLYFALCFTPKMARRFLNKS